MSTCVPQPNVAFKNGFKTSSQKSFGATSGLSCRNRSENCDNRSVSVASEIVAGNAIEILLNSCTNVDSVRVVSFILSRLDDAKGFSIARSYFIGSASTVLGTAVGRGRIKANNDSSFNFLRSLSLSACISLQIFVPRWFFMMFSMPTVPHFFFALQSGQVMYPSLSTLMTGILS
jgi:hypothetical protein